jgi:hypothetical protein
VYIEWRKAAALQLVVKHQSVSHCQSTAAVLSEHLNCWAAVVHLMLKQSQTAVCPQVALVYCCHLYIPILLLWGQDHLVSISAADRAGMHTRKRWPTGMGHSAGLVYNLD